MGRYRANTNSEHSKGLARRLRNSILGVGAAATLAYGFSSLAYQGSAYAEPICGIHRDVLDRLKEAYSETPDSIGLASNGAIIEVLVSDKKTWTIVMTQPNGVSCLMAVGEDWQEVPRNKKKAEIKYQK